MGDSEPDLSLVKMHLTQAYTRAFDPDVIGHLHAALRELDPDAPSGLTECPVCECVGLPERIADHACRRARVYRGP